jgi:pyruvate,orthophosphate dikinase
MGFKAYNLLRMTELGLRVPPAFVLGTRHSLDEASRRAARERAAWGAGLRALEQASRRRFGDARKPLLLSVRSGAPVSMPGMMDTLLNIGLTDATLPGLLRQTGHPRLVWDSYRRLVADYGEIVAGLPADAFEAERTALFGGRDERELDFAELRTLTRRCLAAFEHMTGRPFPQDPQVQLEHAIGAVHDSWRSPRACEYRRCHGIAEDVGTAVTVQSMVFGNAGGHSGAGVGFTRDPSTGERVPWVDFLFNAQGEDVVSGRRSARGHEALANVLPQVWQALREDAARLEHAFADMQEFEFTVQESVLYLLQTRTGKRSACAVARIALDMLGEGLIDAAEARRRTAELALDSLTRTEVVSADGAPPAPLAHASSASRGVAVGEIAFDAARAQARHGAGAPVILVRRDAETDDIAALEVAAGMLTARGARTSHAAVVARQLGVVCLVGCGELKFDGAARTVQVGDATLREGDTLTLDGSDGAVYAGALRSAVQPLTDLRQRLEQLRG